MVIILNAAYCCWGFCSGPGNGKQFIKLGTIHRLTCFEIKPTFLSYLGLTVLSFLSYSL